MSPLGWALTWVSVLSDLCFVQASNDSSVVGRQDEVPSWQMWGPYRPNLYFGVRPQIPETFLTGLMWASGESRDDMMKTLRDTCEQDDGMRGYGWTAYDTRVGGSQTIRDAELHVDLTTDFIKADDGGSWAVRVAGRPRSDAPDNRKTTVVLHAAIEKAASDDGRALTCGPKGHEGKDRGNVEVECSGRVPALGSFELTVTGDDQNKPVHDTVVNSVEVPEDKIWQAKAVFKDQVQADGDSVAVDNKPGTGNMHFVQMTFEGTFCLTFTYRGSETSPTNNDVVGSGLRDLGSTFPHTVDKVFPRTAPFDDEKYADFSQSLLSNLLGGMGFFHGDSKVDNSHAPEYEETDINFWKGAAAAMGRAEITTTPATSLLTFTPSRPFFPRGFLWDEGFHLLPVIEWDLDLAVSVMRSWLDLMDEDGWIPREQILGPEARNRVPEKFQVQYPHYANPPTLLLLFPILISKITGTSAYSGHTSTYLSSEDDAKSMLNDLYPLLARHYNWFRRTQAGNFTGDYARPDGVVSGEGYRWRGRTPSHTLTSGLDDYPRANPPHPAELHVDALSWVGASAKALHEVAEYLGEDDDAATYKKQLADTKHNLDVLHWDKEEKTYCDATVEEGAYKRVCHQGYISLFPLLTGLLDADHPNLPHQLDLLSDSSKLWSSYGLRSLSATDKYYRTEEDYWRGPVWMPLNVLATLRLRDVGSQDSWGEENTDVQRRATSLASELRENLVNTVYKSWEETGFVWEQYDDKTGEGRHSRAFTGWTACVILLTGLEFTGETGQGRARTGASGSSVPIIVLIAIVGLIVVFRRRIMSSASHMMGRLGARRKWEAGRRYEEVIDLDGHGP